MSKCIHCEVAWDLMQLQHAGIFFERDGEQNHIGLLYRRNNGVYKCELAWHFVFRNEPVEDKCLNWREFDFLDEDNGPAFRARLIALDANTKIRYGFVENPKSFDADLRFTPQPVGQGLTCATFVAAVLESYGIPLFLHGTWQRREDDVTWQQMIIEKVEERDTEQAAAMKSTVGAFRYRPEEVAAATMSVDAPLHFSVAVSRAALILSV